MADVVNRHTSQDPQAEAQARAAAEVPPPTAAEIRQQLDRVLAHPLFRNSKRYPNLLRYVVEQSLTGGAQLKERTLGVEVFHRDPDYDTNADPIVRTTAGEIRKRIAQYYHEQGHEEELRIDLPAGSYLPEFHAPAQRMGEAEAAGVAEGRPGRWKPVLWVLAATLPALLVSLMWWKPWVQATPLERFWQPVVSYPSTVLVCVGQRPSLNFRPGTPPHVDPQSLAPAPDATPENEITLYQLYMMGRQNVAFPDVSTMARVTGLLQSRGKQFRLRGELSTSFADLREGPVVLIGGFNNDWTMRLMGTMRYGFEREGPLFRIVDRKNPSNRSWQVDYSKPYLALSEDYALISRGLDPTTGRMVVVVAGLAGYGTMAAAELLTSAEAFEAVGRMAQVDWQTKNVQVVVATRVIHGNSGPPRVLAVESW